MMRWTIPLSGAVLSLWLTSSVPAAPTHVHELNRPEDYLAGKFQDMALHSEGRLFAGPRTKKQEIAVEEIWKSASVGSTVFFTTGAPAALYRLEPGGQPEKLFQTDDAALTAVASDGGTWVVAAGMGSGRLYRIRTTEAPAESGPEAWVTLPAPNAQVWDLLSDGQGGWVLATGPEGVLYHIDSDGEIETRLDAQESNLTALALDSRKRLVIGTSDNGLLYRLESNGSAGVLFDFNESEVTAIVPDGEALWIVVNELKQRGKPAAKSSEEQVLTQIIEAAALAAGFGQDDGEADGEGASIAAGSPNSQPQAAPSAARPRRPEWLSGAIYRLDADGRVERIRYAPNRPVLGMVRQQDGWMAAALGNPAQVFRLRDASGWELILSDEAAHAATLSLARGVLGFAATSHPAQVFSISAEPNPKAVYLSEPIDAGFPARWGAATWEGEGVTVRFRTGHTAAVDDSWGEWSVGSVDGHAEIGGDYARYLQLKVESGRETDRFAYGKIYYSPANQRPEIDRVWVEETAPAGKGRRGPAGAPAKPGNVDNNRAGAERTDEVSSNSGVKSIQWEASDPNGDKLLFDIFLQPLEEPKIRVKLNHDPVEGNRFPWNAATLADGWYLVWVEASDRAINAPEEAMSLQLASPPVLVDNGLPEVLGLSFSDGRIAGRATDEVGPVSSLEVGVDGGPWYFLAARDGVFDESEESFDQPLPEPLPSGAHVIAVRAADMAGNRSVSQLTVKIP